MVLMLSSPIDCSRGEEISLRGESDLSAAASRRLVDRDLVFECAEARLVSD
jgi:hypothetical protein